MCKLFYFYFFYFWFNEKISHAGVDSFPDTFGTRDVNEATSPASILFWFDLFCENENVLFFLFFSYSFWFLAPGIRVIDAYNPHDPALTDIVKGL